MLLWYVWQAAAPCATWLKYRTHSLPRLPRVRAVAVSILILTLNEETNIAECVRSVQWSDDVVVLDSGSTDRTTEICRELGVRVVRRAFDNWSAHQNWAVGTIEFKHA